MMKCVKTFKSRHLMCNFLKREGCLESECGNFMDTVKIAKEIKLKPRKKMIKNLKTTARKKVNAGIRVLIAEDREGELYSKPLYPHILAESLFSQKSVPFIRKGEKNGK